MLLQKWSFHWVGFLSRIILIKSNNRKKLKNMKLFPKAPSFRLDGKRALVTGASSGIGLGCAIAFAEKGAEVTLAARNKKDLLEVSNYITSKGWTSKVLPLDITNVQQTAEKILQNGPFDILLNSAGQARHTSSLETIPSDFDAVMSVNLRGAYFLTQAIAKGLINNNKSGSLINISSQMAHVGGLERSVYCASKFAVEGFTKAMAIELGKNKIRINTICPTFILTPLTKPSFDDPEKKEWILNKIKLGRAGEVEDIMGAAVYLASDTSNLVTGTSIIVDGGWTAD